MNQSSEQPRLQNTPLQTEDYQEETFRYGFRIAELGFLIPQGAHSTFIESAAVFPVPNTINWLRGLANVRGNMVPVFDLGRMLEADIKPIKNALMVMVLGKRSIAFNADSGQSLKESALSLSNISIPEQFKEFTGKIYQDQQTRWIEFDFLKCLSHYENRISV
jgi:chemotaxis signal transduction protein